MGVVLESIARRLAFEGESMAAAYGRLSLSNPDFRGLIDSRLAAFGTKGVEYDDQDVEVIDDL